VTSAMDNAVLGMLSDSGQTLSSNDEGIRGRKVKDSDGKDLGWVEDLLIDERHKKVRFRDHGAAGPAYDPELVNDEPYLGAIYSCYGNDPYWHTGYGYPLLASFPDAGTVGGRAQDDVERTAP
jgi:PRC-barrel domain protein